jgi:hypothetical protein
MARIQKKKLDKKLVYKKNSVYNSQFFKNLSLGNRKSAPQRLGLDLLDTSSAHPRRTPQPLHTLFRRSATVPFSPLHTLAQIRQKSSDGHWFPRFMPFVRFKDFFSFSAEKRKSSYVNLW